ncbi:hypothetical protein LTS18_007668 [Coniosporium uncinatum]|uniref:Uncharacterized protein n=1 Tax=Coniosporium uncinatum TaxID=93489 RepID=A0ACC3DC68_9PEZI|nr:hypothetical protein LTS18_007668 [Coniosporium uncinatum]
MTQDALSQKATGFNCMSGRREPEPALTRHFLPDKSYLDANCDQGIRFELMFPSCWNGRDLDSADHRSHIQYPHLVNTGSCPPEYPVRLPSLYYETIWATSDYSAIDGSFVIANGDTTGYGYHGDFMSGWEEQFLQNAVDVCTNASGRVEDCPLFELQSDAQASLCKFDVPDTLRDENCGGPRQGLCGNVTDL